MPDGSEQINIESRSLRVRQITGSEEVCPCCGATWKTYWGGLVRRYHRLGCDYIIDEKINEKYLHQSEGAEWKEQCREERARGD